MTPLVEFESAGRAARILINRPPLNILDLPTIEALASQLVSLEGSSLCSILELGGAGDRAFCAGVEIGDHTRDRAEEMLTRFHALCRQLLKQPQVTLAVVRGHCLGGGSELAACCDFVLAEHAASFGQPEVDVGCFPPVASVVLPRLIGVRRASEMILTGEPISGRRAAEIGLITRSVDIGTLDREVEQLKSRLLEKSGAVLAIMQRALRADRLRAFNAMIDEAQHLYLHELLRTDDAVEGVNAFLERRPARWKHR